MDSQRFDALTRRLGGAGSRRRVLAALVAGTLGTVLGGAEPFEAAAGPKKKGKGGGKGKGRGKSCPPEKPCRSQGTCRGLCGDGCCADCFVEVFSNGVPDLAHPVCCLASGGTVCGPKSKKKKKKKASKNAKRASDRCCYPDQVCAEGTCCCDGCEGAVVCGGTCCAAEACCNGTCCPAGQVCETTPNGQVCVSADRACGGPNDCFASEVCHGGICCSGKRVCNDGTNDFCCAADEYCEFPGVPLATCCPFNTICKSTYRGHRVRP